jgi:hypothetical protein
MSRFVERPLGEQFIENQELRRILKSALQIGPQTLFSNFSLKKSLALAFENRSKTRVFILVLQNIDFQ